MSHLRPFAPISSAGYYRTSAGTLSHFHVTEMTCRCGCGLYEMDQQQIDLLEKIRAKLGNVPMHVPSGVRCWTYNKAIGGAPASQHLPRTPAGVIVKEAGPAILHTGAGRATDFTVKTLQPSRVQWLIDDMPELKGMGSYSGFTHADSRTGRRARW